MERSIFAGDIGGTKTDLALFNFDGGGPEGGSLKMVWSKRYLNSGYTSFLDILDDFIGALPAATPPPASALSAGTLVLGVAGPVSGNSCDLTNLGWRISGKELEVSLGIGEVVLLNDVEAAAYGIGDLGEGTPLGGGSPLGGGIQGEGPQGEALRVINEGRPSGTTKALLSLGTGLGEAIIRGGEEGAVVIPTEGGHRDFAPQSDIERELCSSLKERYSASSKGHVSYERVLSGKGIEDIFTFLEQRGGFEGRGEAERSDELKVLFKEFGMAKVITGKATSGEGGLFGETMELFLSVLGAECGNLFLSSMAGGGIYLSGGITPKIIDLVSGSETFMSAFTAKGRFGGILKEVPVYGVMDEGLTLKGCGRYGVSYYRR